MNLAETVGVIITSIQIISSKRFMIRKPARAYYFANDCLGWTYDISENDFQPEWDTTPPIKQTLPS